MKASDIARTIENSSWQVWALSALGTTLAQAGQRAEAVRVIGTITDSSEQAEALSAWLQGWLVQMNLNSYCI